MKINKKQLIFVIAITLIALFLRVVNIQHSNLWVDELYCFDIASKPNVFEILKTVFSKDLHAPLFFIILHFWIKIFKTADVSLIMLPVVFSALCIPAGYFIAKKLFNTRAAVVLSIFTTFNALELAYAQELKFYSLLPLLGLLSSYFFLQISEIFDNKKAVWLLLINTVIIYTFNAGIFFVFAELLTGLTYLIFKKKENLKKFILTFITTGILYIPYFYFQIKTMLGLNKSICTLFDIFNFDMGFVYSLIHNFFTPCLVNLSNNEPNFSIITAYKNFGPYGFIFYVLFFLTIAFYGIYRSIKEKNQKILLLLSVSVIFVSILIALALAHIIPLLTRYTLLVHLMMLLSVSYGLSLINNKKLLTTILTGFVVVSVFALLLYKDTPIFQKSSFHYYSAQVLKNTGAKDKDIIIMPYFGRFLYKYFNKGQLIDYRSEELLMESDAFLMKETFDLTDEEYSTKDKSNLKLKRYINEEKAPKQLENYFYQNYISKMQPGTGLFLVENYLFCIIPPELYKPIATAFNQDSKDLPLIYKTARYSLLYTKILNNLESIFGKHLKLVRIYYSKEQDVKILEYLKEK